MLPWQGIQSVVGCNCPTPSLSIRRSRAGLFHERPCRQFLDVCRRQFADVRAAGSSTIHLLVGTSRFLQPSRNLTVFRKPDAQHAATGCRRSTRCPKALLDLQQALECEGGLGSSRGWQWRFQCQRQMDTRPAGLPFSAHSWTMRLSRLQAADTAGRWRGWIRLDRGASWFGSWTPTSSWFAYLHGKAVVTRSVLRLVTGANADDERADAGYAVRRDVANGPAPTPAESPSRPAIPQRRILRSATR
jgi:hypothetical protein